MSEADHQSSLFRWARMQENVRPELRMLFCIPNGGYALSKHQGWMMKQRGVKPGVPDTCLAVARRGYHGMYIEMKNDEPKGKLSAEQEVWIADLTAEGFAAKVAFGWEEAKDFIEWYLAP